MHELIIHYQKKINLVISLDNLETEVVSLLLSRAAYAIKVIYMEILIFPTYFQQNDILDRGTTFKQQLTMLISYLTDLTSGRRTDDSQATRYRGHSTDNFCIMFIN